MLIREDWLSIIYKDGKLNEEQILKELDDYAFLMIQASKVYNHFTNLSKTNYFAETIISLIEERTYDKDITRDDLKSMIEDCDTKEELVEELKKYFEVD